MTSYTCDNGLEHALFSIVKVTHGLNDGLFSLPTGTSVGSLRASLVDAFNLPEIALPFVNGEPVPANHRLLGNNSLEFIVTKGKKGTEQNRSIRIPVQPISGAEPLMCCHNVQKRIRAMGGKAVFGWAVRHDDYNLLKQNHCVWEDDNGQLWDVTPVFQSVQGEIAIIGWPDDTEFERDDGASFEDRSLPTRYVPTHPSPYVATACKYMERADEFLRQGDLNRCRYWTERANREMVKAKLSGGWDTPSSMILADVLRSMNQ